MTALVEIEGIGHKYASKFSEVAISTVEALLDVGASAKGRKDLAAKTGIRSDLILRWINHADLFRIKGVGEEYAELLEAAGVDTVPDLGRRNASKLHQKLVEVNQKKELVRQLPSLTQVEDWIKQAQHLPRIINY
jgi:predicted flap endonuclease-1-like 5' DNA nuclease